MADSPDLPPLSPDPAPAAPRPVAPAPPPRPGSGLGRGVSTLWTLLLRLLILGAGVSLGWLTGMLIAQVLPSRNPNPPLTEVALRHSSQTVRKLRQLPRWWQGGGSLAAGEQVSALESVPLEAGEAPGAVGTNQPNPPSAEGDRDRLQDDLSRLEQDLASLNARLGALETTLGSTDGSLEERVQQLNQRLSTSPEPGPTAADEPPEAPSPAEAEASGTRSPYQEPRFPLVSDRIVLPSALLFVPGSSTLTPAGQQLLDSIASDLRRYGAVTLLVGSHTDGLAEGDQASQLTLQQSLAVQQHLAPELDGEGIRWVALGYGQTRPSAGGSTPSSQQRNQRVEIGIVPRN
ncbi:OmpA family protein [Nodosilinea sp. E11]|uniref:OmpA family protein n=1 Tax=Nodosilinea sp. E11 TaxID=3037479 RepID=UPI0029341946|nr:OmpA family protein [Nodosilinea sp. E11]WOD40777.1 OmpA family protein [Nodosilinea sp. E11]